MRSLASTEHSQLLAALSSHLSTTFPALLIPMSPTHQHSALFELKAGVGGDEAALFVSDLLRMYGRVGEAHGWQVEVISKEETEGGKGTKTSVLEVKGEGAYDALRWESGVHRVQRVPETEKSGRVHTSTAAVVVSVNCNICSSNSPKFYLWCCPLDFLNSLLVANTDVTPPGSSAFARSAWIYHTKTVRSQRYQGGGDACTGCWRPGAHLPYELSISF